MEYKTCFKCGRSLPLSFFYKHPKMKDGYLNKCKDCLKKDASVRYIEKSKNTEWKEKERTRGREKYKRLHYYEKYKYVAISTILPLSYRTISRKAHKMGLVKKGFEFHHWNYNLLNSGFIVSREAHKCIHRHMSFNRKKSILLQRKWREAC